MRKLKLAILLLFFSVTAHALTLTQLLTEERLRIKDTSSSHQRYTDTQLTSLTNEASRDVINNTWAIEKISTFTTTSGATYYSIPSDFLAPSRITSNSVLIPEKTLISLDADAAGGVWQTQGGLPQYYFIDGAQTNELGFYPWPNTATTTTTIQMNYYASPTILVSGSDVAYNGIVQLQQYADLIIFYVAYRIYLVEGEVDKATLYRQEYESRIQVMAQANGQKPNYNPGVTGTGKGR